MLRRSDPLANPEPLIRRVYSYAAYRLGDGADAEDATSETLERALRYRQSLGKFCDSQCAFSRCMVGLGMEPRRAMIIPQ